MGLGELTGTDGAGGFVGWLTMMVGNMHMLTHTHARADHSSSVTVSTVCFQLSASSFYTYTLGGHTLVRVVDAELLQKQAVVEEATVDLGQELEDDASL